MSSDASFQEYVKRQLAKTVQPAPCACVGPQAGQPRCPCAMRSVIVKNGRYVIPEQDLGPAVNIAPPSCGALLTYPIPKTGGRTAP
jgi:hypothetical protein